MFVMIAGSTESRRHTATKHHGRFGELWRKYTSCVAFPVDAYQATSLWLPVQMGRQPRLTTTIGFSGSERRLLLTLPQGRRSRVQPCVHPPPGWCGCRLMMPAPHPRPVAHPQSHSLFQGSPCSHKSIVYNHPLGGSVYSRENRF